MLNTLEEERWDLLARVAQLYYVKNLTQAEIARKLKISRPRISRLLAECLETGVVEININYPPNALSNLRQQVLNAFKLKEVYILHAGDLGYAQMVEQLGVLAARHLEEKLTDDLLLGISWNLSVYHVVKALQASRRENVTVVQLTGAVGTINPIMDGPDLTRWLAQTMGANYKYLHTPLLVENPITRQVLLQDRAVRDTMTLMESLDMALVGIGSLMPALSSLLQAGHLDETELRDIVRQGGVGEICGHHYGLLGEVLRLPLHRRLIGVSLEALRRTPYVIGIAGGLPKASAIFGALNLGILDCLITDEIAARTILKMKQNTNANPNWA